jgi:hypothetical protein
MNPPDPSISQHAFQVIMVLLSGICTVFSWGLHAKLSGLKELFEEKHSGTEKRLDRLESFCPVCNRVVYKNSK